MEGAAKTWRDHPLVIAVIVAVATFTVTTLVFREVVIPTQLASLQNQIAPLQRDLDAQKADVARLNTQLQQLQDQLRTAKVQRDEAQAANLFAVGSVYPVGLGKVKLGDTLDLLPKVYPEEAIERTAAFLLSVRRQHPVFTDIGYYSERGLSGRKINQVYFRSTLDKEALHGRFVEMYGVPSENPKPGFYLWKLSDKIWLFITNSNGFSIVPEGSVPGTWPEDALPRVKKK